MRVAHKVVEDTIALFGIPTLAKRPDEALPLRIGNFAWDGKALALSNRHGKFAAESLLHELAHYQVAAPHRRRRRDFGLYLVLGQGEENMASLLGIAWEAHLFGMRRAMRRFAEHNWREGARTYRERLDETFRIFRGLFMLQARGYLDERGCPTRKVRQKGEKKWPTGWEEEQE